MIKNAVKEMSTVLKELIFGILLLGVVFQLLFVWFTSDKGSFAVGLWLGVGIAVFMAVHMNYSIEQSLEMQEEDAQGYMRKMVVLRMGVMILAMAAICFLHLGSVAALFLGVLSLKFGAYLQPVLHRLNQKLCKKGR
ncbi:MAG: hypothetical protein UDG86_09470 [Lachnospiraceae bacterium]|jgi:hypothetical protein|nr:hypothetical protein [Lachnospiraceae bacterium]